MRVCTNCFVDPSGPACGKTRY